MKKYFVTRAKYNGQIEVLEQLACGEVIYHSINIRYDWAGEYIDYDFIPNMQEQHASAIYDAVQDLGVSERVRRFLRYSQNCPGIQWTHHPGDPRKEYDEGWLSWEIELVPLYIETHEFITEAIGDKMIVRRRGEVDGLICNATHLFPFFSCVEDPHLLALIAYCTQESFRGCDEVAAKLREANYEEGGIKFGNDITLEIYEKRIYWTVDIPTPFRN